MKVILMEDIKGVGKKDQVIDASDGYARNFLLPRKKAVEANAENMSKLNAKNNSIAYKKEMDLKEAKEIAKRMNDITVVIKVKSGENGKIFGGVTSKEISEELKKSFKIDVDKKKIVLNDTIKNLGRFTVDVKLNEGVQAKLTVNIISE